MIKVKLVIEHQGVSLPNMLAYRFKEGDKGIVYLCEDSQVYPVALVRYREGIDHHPV